MTENQEQLRSYMEGWRDGAAPHMISVTRRKTDATYAEGLRESERVRDQAMRKAAKRYGVLK